ncbi:NUDIX hydrolase [Bacillus testis]|uniref:NUDIX hydrolase n=1 Tax=Bacillus testis TaxID=1622072 RepID=UPI000A6FDF7D|nr:NUDIX domain-containing protein [Bacillus testis]
MQLDFYKIGTINEEELRFAVISAIYQNKWVYVRQKDRTTWETPGGHRDLGEAIIRTAKRELFEETGAVRIEIVPICDYSLNDSSGKRFGRLFFSTIIELDQLPDSEINEVNFFEMLPRNLTYAEIQPRLFEKTIEFLNAKEGS